MSSTSTTTTTRMHETWDEISYRVYGDEHHVADLIAANFDQRATLFFDAGTVLNVPADSGTSLFSESLPPWKRRTVA